MKLLGIGFFTQKDQRKVRQAILRTTVLTFLLCVKNLNFKRCITYESQKYFSIPSFTDLIFGL